MNRVFGFESNISVKKKMTVTLCYIFISLYNIWYYIRQIEAKTSNTLRNKEVNEIAISPSSHP